MQQYACIFVTSADLFEAVRYKAWKCETIRDTFVRQGKCMTGMHAFTGKQCIRLVAK